MQKSDIGTINDQSRVNDHHQSTSYSPRRLIKQVALESPPNQSDYDSGTGFYKGLKLDNQSKIPIYVYLFTHSLNLQKRLH